MKKIKLIKVEELPDAHHPNNISVGEYRVGAMDIEPIVGKSFFMPHIVDRNGTGCGFGAFFYTSPVMEILERNSFSQVIKFKTLNSIYQIEILADTFHLSDIIATTKIPQSVEEVIEDDVESDDEEIESVDDNNE